MPKGITEDWMHLQFVGSGDAFGSGGRFNTCFHVVGAETNFLIDCGASSLIAMNRFGIDRNAIDFILLTHFHADHCGGVPFFHAGCAISGATHPPADRCRAGRPEGVVSAPDGRRLRGLGAFGEKVSRFRSWSSRRTSPGLQGCGNPARAGPPRAAQPTAITAIASRWTARCSPIAATPNGPTA